jgi:hypothetical protein
MHGKTKALRHWSAEKVQKNERLKLLTQASGINHPRDRSMPGASMLLNNGSHSNHATSFALHCNPTPVLQPCNPLSRKIIVDCPG